MENNVSHLISCSFYELHYFCKVRRRHFKGTSHTNEVFIDLKEVDVQSLTSIILSLDVKLWGSVLRHGKLP